MNPTSQSRGASYVGTNQFGILRLYISYHLPRLDYSLQLSGSGEGDGSPPPDVPVVVVVVVVVAVVVLEVLLVPDSLRKNWL